MTDFVLIGERHGVEDQQLTITALLDELSKSEKKVGVVREMINVDQAALYEPFRKLSRQSPKDFGYATGWSTPACGAIHFLPILESVGPLG